MRKPTRQPVRGRLIRLGVNERRGTPSRCAGVVATACTQGKRTQHGKPHDVVSDDQPDAREGQAGRLGVAERFVVPLKLGNAGGGKGPQFKTNATRSEGPGDWATYQLRRGFRNCRRRCTRKRRQKPATASTPCTTRSAGSSVMLAAPDNSAEIADPIMSNLRQTDSCFSCRSTSGTRTNWKEREPGT